MNYRWREEGGYKSDIHHFILDLERVRASSIKFEDSLFRLGPVDKLGCGAGAIDGGLSTRKSKTLQYRSFGTSDWRVLTLGQVATSVLGHEQTSETHAHNVCFTPNSRHYPVTVRPTLIYENME